MIREYLEQTVKAWDAVGHPALMERFVLAKGKEYRAGPLIGKPGTPKECFANAARFVWSNPAALYVEGFVMKRSLGIAIHHAWVDLAGMAMDNTLRGDLSEAEYMGVPFDRETMAREITKSGYYGLLSLGPAFINTDLIFDMAPELRAAVKGSA